MLLHDRLWSHQQVCVFLANFLDIKPMFNFLQGLEAIGKRRSRCAGSWLTFAQCGCVHIGHF